jgi:hypothetical protein
MPQPLKRQPNYYDTLHVFTIQLRTFSLPIKCEYHSRYVHVLATHTYATSLTRARMMLTREHVLNKISPMSHIHRNWLTDHYYVTEILFKIKNLSIIEIKVS